MLTIDLAAIQQNWLKLCSLSSSSVAAVIKANAYGLGAREISCALFAVGCREFFVASLTEACEARTYLPRSAIIYVLGGTRSGDNAHYINENLIPVLCSVQDVEAWVVYSKTHKIAARVAIKIDTGMSRLGLSESEFSVLCEDTEALKYLNPCLFMSHLACADEPSHPLNNSQFVVFSRCAKKVREIFSSARLSLANSSGIFLGKPWHFDVLRPGAALYGINPTPSHPNPMLPVVSLSLPIIQVRTLEMPSFIGYGATVHLPPGARLAVVAGGYADGVHRAIGLKPEGLLYGQKVTAVGRISMDSIVFDISAIPLTTTELQGAFITVIGDHAPLDMLMAKDGALGYDVLTSLGRRYQRIYLPGSI